MCVCVYICYALCEHFSFNLSRLRTNEISMVCYTEVPVVPVGIWDYFPPILYVQKEMVRRKKRKNSRKNVCTEDGTHNSESASFQVKTNAFQAVWLTFTHLGYYIPLQDCHSKLFGFRNIKNFCFLTRHIFNLDCFWRRRKRGKVCYSFGFLLNSQHPVLGTVEIIKTFWLSRDSSVLITAFGWWSPSV